LPGFGSLQLEGMGHGLTGNRERQGQASGVEWGLGPGRSGLLRAGLHIVRMDEQGGNGRGDERGMQEGLQGARPLGVDRVQAVDRFVQPDAQCCQR